MKHHRYRRRTVAYRIVNRRGEYLSRTDTLPFTWTDREAFALVYLSRAAVDADVARYFMGPHAAHAQGIRVERVE